jgi:phage replication initiation protein
MNLAPDTGAVIDWLSFTLGPTAWNASGLVEMIRTWLISWSGGEPVAGESANGLHGYEKSVRFYSVVNHQPCLIGVVAWGGNNGTAYVSLNGSYCGQVCYWDLVANTLQAVSARVTRLDLAVDALGGEFSVEDACAWYGEGGFTGNGRRPTHSCEGDWLAVADSEGRLSPRGRTLYVGRREHGKYARIYEKGKQLGNPDSSWARFEVEIKNRDRVIPYDAIRRPSEYFAGSYPCAEQLVDVGAERIRTSRAEGEISLERMRAYCRSAYGRLVHVLRLRTSDHVELLDSLAIEGIPRRLEKSALSLQNLGHQQGPPLERASQ